jgi:hypothetical protein
MDRERAELVLKRFNRLVARLRLPPIRLHDLRHSYAIAALSAGVHPKIVSERLGHASIAFTLTQYSHVLPGVDPGVDQEAAARTIAELMLGDSVGKSVSNGPMDVTRASIPVDERPGRRGSGGRI